MNAREVLQALYFEEFRANYQDAYVELNKNEDS